MAFNPSHFRNTPFSSGGTNNKQDLVIASPAYFEVQFDDSIYETFFNNAQVVGKGNNIAASNPTLAALVKDALRHMRFRISSTDLPSRQVVGVQRQASGPFRIVPYAANYSTIMLEIIETPNFNVRALFDTWIDFIEGKQQWYQSLYYDDLVMKYMSIYAFNKFGDCTGQWKFQDVFPIGVNSSVLNWQSQNGIIMVPVELSFSTWDFIPMQHGAPRNGRASG